MPLPFPRYRQTQRPGAESNELTQLIGRDRQAYTARIWCAYIQAPDTADV